MYTLISTLALLIITQIVNCQNISYFSSLSPGNQSSYLVLPESHTFQFIIRKGDSLTDGNILPGRCDFAGFVPDTNSGKGFLSISSEEVVGGVSILQIELTSNGNGWITTSSGSVNFDIVGGTSRNCSGTVTPWKTIITCEENTSADNNGDGFNDFGWAIEIDPATRMVVDHPGGLTGGDKLWALGNFKHENLVIHENQRTAYQGVDDNIGYLFKYVADTAGELSSGNLFVYKGSKNGSGLWIKLKNNTPSDQNCTLQQCADTGATVFSGIEDVEISPIDSMVYLAVKNEDRVYRFIDSDPLTGTSVPLFETYVGGQSYPIDLETHIEYVDWGTGNDNLAFDNKGNLWVMQDGDDHYIWVVDHNHTPQNPAVRIFARTPSGSEPTGLTFTPDNKFMFMSIQHPDTANSITSQPDAFGIDRSFDKDVVLSVALKSQLNVINESVTSDFFVRPNPASDDLFIHSGRRIYSVAIYCSNGKLTGTYNIAGLKECKFNTANLIPGIYLLVVRTDDGFQTKKIVIEP